MKTRPLGNSGLIDGRILRRSLLKLRDAGKIRAIGLRCGGTAVVSDQFRYSMLHRDPEQDILPSCARNDLATLTYMSLEQGLLTGKVGLDRVFGKDEFRSNGAWYPWYLPANRRRVLDLLDAWRGLTRRYQCTLAQLVIAWTAAQPGVTHVLCGARHVDQAKDNAAAGNLTLAPEDIHQMRRDVEALGEPVHEEAAAVTA